MIQLAHAVKKGGKTNRCGRKVFLVQWARQSSADCDRSSYGQPDENANDRSPSTSKQDLPCPETEEGVQGNRLFMEGLMRVNDSTEEVNSRMWQRPL